MSCDFDLFCKDCSTWCGFHDLNWGGDDLLPVLKYRKQLEQIGSTDPEMRWWWDDSGRLGTAVFFFSAHVGHQIIVLSEYGQPYSGTCHDRLKDGFCCLEKGHEGEHSIPPKLNWNEVTRRYEEDP